MEKTSVERSLDASIKDGASYAVMIGLGETYVGACALFLGASKSAVALLVTIPLFLGSCAQLITPLILDRTGRRRPICVIGALVQAFAWLPMIAGLFVPRPLGFWLLLGGFMLYFVCIHITIPAWMSLMGDLVPPRVRGRYFGMRNGLAFFMQFLGSLIGGLGLWVYEKRGNETLGFAVIFTGALVARVISASYLSRMAEPPFQPLEEDRFTLRQFLGRLPRSNFAKFVIFVACLNASAHFVGSLFVPYWRETLNYSYGQLTAVLMTVILTQFPALVIWGRLSDRYGNKNVLIATAIGITLAPLFWLTSTNVFWACAFQLWGGFFWSGFNQSVSNFLFDAVTPAKRARCTAYLNLIANFGILVGGVAGSILIEVVPTHLGPVRLPYAMWSILILSFVFRLTTVSIFMSRFREVRDVPKVGVVEMLFHATREATDAAVNLMAGLVPRAEGKKPPTDSASKP